MIEGFDAIHYSVGKTRTDKVIYCVQRLEDARNLAHLVLPAFDDDEILDAYAVFMYLAARATRRDEDNAIFSRLADYTARMLGSERLDDTKVRAGVLDAFGLNKLGATLVNIEFKDL